ncbi:MAG: ATP-grasp domain-containing protein [Candidatus Obscuribacterales bacterium]|nr:ATP-grasp domain-containing protein [Candidatus Obscuribacterales bacterium]
MNIVFLSPHFPPNFYNFCVRLREQGANVFGIGDQPFEQLRDELKQCLSEYYRVDDMHNYDQLLRAVGYFTYRFGKMDRIDSQNEYWLETEARLRTDFNISGIKLDSIYKIKRKSEMKRVFENSGLNPARGKVCQSEAELRAFIEEVGFPVVAKPDIGVGAAKTYKIDNEEELQRYLKDKPPSVDYIVEEFVSGTIVTYDGLTDSGGNVVFASSLRYSKGVMEAVNEDSDIYYYTVREIENTLEQAGRLTLRAFDVRERFFHFEFFMFEDGSVIPLEVNMRPPGGFTLDMFNFANDFDAYKAWAEILVHGKTSQEALRPYFVIYVGRKDHIPYSMRHQEVLEEFNSLMVYQDRMNDAFSRAIGNHGYVLRHQELDPLVEAADRIMARY